jgi:hypothetical protein
MGFPEDLGKLALIKVKNESVAAAVEAVVSLQVEQVNQQEKEAPKEKEEKKVTVVQWDCEICTVINQPGGTKCHICFGQAPASAYVDEEAEKAKKDAQEKAEKAEEERLAREKELAEERMKQLELKRQEEEKEKEKIKQTFEKTQQFLAHSKVLGYLFSSIRNGKDRRPLLVGAVMQHSEECVTDLHLKSLAYRRQYLDNFMSTPTAAGAVENRLTRERFESEEECLESLLMNNQSLLESLYPALGDNRDASKSIFSHLGVNQVMGSADVGVVRLPLKEVSLLCQIGKDVSPESPLLVLVQGRRKDDVISTFLVSISHTGAAHSAGALCLEVKEV